MNGSYFDPKDEPDEFMFDFIADCNRILEDKGYDVLQIKFKNHDDYYRIMNNCREFTKNNLKVYGVSYDDPEILIQKEDDMIAEHEIERPT